MPCPNCSCTSCLLIAGSPAMPLAEFPPPPSELMTTNRAPTDSELASSRIIIGSAKKRISMIEAMLDDLERQKTELLGLVSTHRTAIAPLKSFPPEIWVKVFAEWATCTIGYFHRSTCPMLIVMGMCSQWRRIALDTPRLWTRILENLPKPMIDSWIIRSKALPLDIQLNLSRLDASSSSALNALIPHSPRWERVYCTLGPNSNPALAPVKTHLPALKILKLAFVDVTGTIDFCEAAPQLTEIRLRMVCQPTPVVIKLPWEQLRVCTIDNSGVALYILQQAKHLRTCRLDMHNVYERPWSPMPSGSRIHHPELVTFIIDWSPKDHSMPSFFSSLTLPSLQTLEVYFPLVPNNSSPSDEDSVNGPQFGSIIFSFFERSSTHLNTLILAGIIPLSSSQLISCLALVPSLISLDIQYDRWYGHGIDEKLLNSLNINLPGSILHRLRSLFLGGQCHFSEESLDALVMSRRDINPTDVHRVTLLENLTLGCAPPDDWPTSRLPLFHRFVSGGLNITYGVDWRGRNPNLELYTRNSRF